MKDQTVNNLLRPKKLEDVIGQKEAKERLQIMLTAAKKRNEILPHILLSGPPGLGKTTLATVLPNETGAKLIMTSGPVIDSPKDLLPYLVGAPENSVLFIDEIHRMPIKAEEFMYPALEDGRIEFLVGEGLAAQKFEMPLKPMTIIGATTRVGMISKPMRDRFVAHLQMEFYSPDDLSKIVANSATKLGVDISYPAARMIADRSRGTPRHANSYLRWVRDFEMSVKGTEVIDAEITMKAFEIHKVDERGLTPLDRRYLHALETSATGFIGLDTMASRLSTSKDTILDEIEPYLLRMGLVEITSRGRTLAC